MTADVTNTHVWNAESEIKTAGGLNYTYDGDGDRVQKSNGKIYWFGAGSQVLDESDASGNITDEYVYFGGKRIAHHVVSTNTLTYYVEDMLGSSRALATSTGTLCYDADFYPYGGEHNYINTCAQNYKFTGKERDPETNNDDFDARYYASAYGRFLSADWSSTPSPVPYANLTNPQTLNLYAMVSDNPESFADLDGHANYSQSNAVAGACTYSGTPACGAQKAAQNAFNSQAGTAAAQNATSSQKLVLVVSSDSQQGSGKNGDAVQRNVDYTVGTMDSKGNFTKDISQPGHTVSMTEVKTGGSDNPTLCNPCGPQAHTLDDHIRVTTTGKDFTTTQTFHIDNQKQPATIIRKDFTTGVVTSGTHAYITATDSSANIRYGP
jgi:RHS repeat-associated protein